MKEDNHELTHEHFYRVFNVIPSPMALSLLDSGRYVEINESFLDVLGYERDEVVGRTSRELNVMVNYEDRQQAAHILSETGRLRNFEAWIRTKNGEIRAGLYSADLLEIQGEKYILSLVNDITDRKRMEEELTLERQKLYTILDHFPGLIALQAPDLSPYFANKVFRETFGVYDDRPCHEVMGFEEPCTYCPTLELFKTGEVANWELSKNNKIFEVYEKVIHVDGSPVSLKVGIDITMRKQAEQELARLDRLNVVGQMAAGIGHEIRNPMTTVRGFLQLLSGKPKYQEDQDYFNLMISELDRANCIITDFLSLAKNKPSELEITNLNTIIQDLYPLMQADALNSHMSINFLPQPVPGLQLNKKEIHQLLLNLVRNGLEAMDRGGVITLRTYLEGEEVVLSVQDQGTGIDAQTLKQMGTPFLTTKEQGTGLGMATCYSIARRHNAKITVATSSAGTIFNIRFRFRN